MGWEVLNILLLELSFKDLPQQENDLFAIINDSNAKQF